MKKAPIWTFIAAGVFSITALAGPTRYEERLSQIWSRFSKSPGSLEAETHLLEMFDLWDTLPPQKILDLLAQAAANPSASHRAKERAKFLLAEGQMRLGEVEAAEKIISQMGFLENWVVAGPFDNEGGTGLGHPYPPEVFGAGFYDTEQPMPGKEIDVRFQQAAKQLSHLGFLHLDPLFSPSNNVCAYAIKTIESAKGGTAILRVGTGGAVQAFWNGHQAISDRGYRRPDPDRFAAEVPIRKGANRLVIKVCGEAPDTLGIYARLTDARFRPWRTIEIPDQLAALTTTVSKGTPSRPRPQTLETLLKKASKQKNQTENEKTADTSYAAAKYMVLTQSLDSSSHLARNLARSACKIRKDESSCLLFAKLAIDPNEKRDAISRIEKDSSMSVSILLARAELEQSGFDSQLALSLLSEAQKLSPADPVVLSQKALLLGNSGLPHLGASVARELLRIHPNLPISISTGLELASQQGNQSGELELRTKSLDHDYSNRQNHEALALWALAQKDENAFQNHLEALEQIGSFDKDTYYIKARLERASGNSKAAIQTLETLSRLAPLDANVFKELGLLLMQSNDSKQGLTHLKHAYSLKPQDASLAEYLTLIAPQKKFETDYEIAPETFLASSKQKPTGEQNVNLVDQTVVRVFRSGLSSRFVQKVILLNSKVAARENREQWIQFSETNQRVKILAARVFRKDGTIEAAVGRTTVPVSEPWYRLYYDVEAELIEYPPLFPGDIVELKYIVEDVGNRNIFGDYFGDFVYIQSEEPTLFWRYVLIRPQEKNFYFNKLPSDLVQVSQKETGALVHHIFEAHDIEGIRREVDMPGMSSIAPYLHLSTYQTWDDLGTWYRGLIRHQIVPDQRIVETVQKLIDEQMSPLEKVRRLYEWVITSTRYVGLEFGIHGFKPYRAPVVVARGFGDCKDKAALLVSMLGEAGIEAEFILIRTRDLGLLDPFPPSLAVFNHAIVHVPSLNLWLDGTAEQHGRDELPFGDQDADALRLGNSKSIFVRTPVLPPSKNATNRLQRITVENSGDALIESSASIKGVEAVRLRRDFETVQTRRDRFEAALQAVHPGAELLDLEIPSLALSRPVSYHYRARIPGYAKSSPKTLEIPISVLKTLVSKYTRSSSRKFDLIIGPPRRDRREVEISLPSDYDILFLPKGTKITTRFGEFEFNIQSTGSSIKMSHILELKTHRIAKEDYKSFLDFCRQIDEILEARIRLGKKP